MISNSPGQPEAQRFIDLPVEKELNTHMIGLAVIDREAVCCYLRLW